MPLKSAFITPELNELDHRHTAATDEVSRFLEGLSPDQLLWSPGREEWSVAQVLDHLLRVGGPLLPKLRDALGQLPPAGPNPAPFRFRLMERWLIGALSPGARFKSPVPPVYIPSSDRAHLADAVERFETLQRDLHRLIQDADGRDLNTVRVASPASRFMRLSVAAWLTATVTHEEYHLPQLRRLREALDRAHA
jgi:hypothetical protein